MAEPDSALQSGKSRIVLLDGMRGIAAICVALMHYYAIGGHIGPFARSYLAVDFFFMLSGFVLVPVVESERPAAAVMWSRLARFWPLMAVGSVLGALAYGFEQDFALIAALLPLALACVPALGLAPALFPLNVPQWSLLFELLANLVHVLLLRRLPTSVLLVFSASCWIALTFAMPKTDGVDYGLHFGEITGALLRLGFAYPLGCVLGRNRAALARLGQFQWSIAPVLLVAMLIVPQLLGLPRGVTDPLILLAFAPVLAIGICAQVPPSFDGQLQWLGAISFPLYAIHFPLLGLGRVIAVQLPGPSQGLAMLAALVLAFGLAHWLAGLPLAQGLKLKSGPRPVPAISG